MNRDNNIINWLIDALHAAHPAVNCRPKTLTAFEGDSLALNCSVDGWPIPEVTFLRDNTTLNTSADPRVMFPPLEDARYWLLTLGSLEMSDRASYACVATNVIGGRRVVGNATVFVRIKSRHSGNLL